jgi:hypothetical protein
MAGAPAMIAGNQPALLRRSNPGLANSLAVQAHIIRHRRALAKIAQWNFAAKMVGCERQKDVQRSYLRKNIQLIWSITYRNSSED